jgi:hypothetical protein
MPMGSGISAMLRLGAGLELEQDVALETISIGPVGNSLAGAYQLETCGAFLLYRVTIAGAEVHVSASLADSIAEPAHLLRTQDCEEGWRLCFAFISSLERHGVRSLVRPIVFGTPGEPDAWVIA